MAGAQADAPSILITRPGPAAARLAEALSAEGWRPLLWPLHQIVDEGPPPDLSGCQAAFFTSANALRRATAGPGAPPAFCVGAATAAAARRAGFADVRSAEGDAAALARLAARALDPGAGALAFFRGRDVAADLAGALRAAGFAMREQVVYAAAQAGPPPPEVEAALRGGALSAACFYSPRAAARFAAFAGAWRAGLGCAAAVAISAAAAAPLADAGFGRVIVAERPDGAAMRAALAMARPWGAGRREGLSGLAGGDGPD
ncbi:uroporphyrinogen-III synthase [Rubrimonas cliftonensis]|uniref:Uroporphyrinogen-III synthase n=1 Tax=Rubrimonas cliftonensis TaxID=89524 RepID=A0A1H4BFK4_9RHOB|nr:uroporphyrinogen-III synthase [Rubrimonas cliftonensis]SEA46953.1 uroporphyrinogen-III synthase [Rubrimonas cliftonensis]